jgi:hypothetical protein
MPALRSVSGNNDDGRRRHDGHGPNRYQYLLLPTVRQDGWLYLNEEVLRDGFDGTGPFKYSLNHGIQQGTPGSNSIPPANVTSLAVHEDSIPTFPGQDSSAGSRSDERTAAAWTAGKLAGYLISAARARTAIYGASSEFAFIASFGMKKLKRPFGNRFANW